MDKVQTSVILPPEIFELWVAFAKAEHRNNKSEIIEILLGNVRSPEDLRPKPEGGNEWLQGLASKSS